MRAHSIGVLATRVLALFVGVQGILMAVTFLPNLELARAIEWLAIGAMLVMSLLLWLAAAPISRAMTRSGTTDGEPRPWSVTDAQTIAFSTVGVYLAAQAIPELIAVAGIGDGDRDPYARVIVLQMIGTTRVEVILVKLGVGLALLLGARRFSRAIDARWGAGRYGQDERRPPDQASDALMPPEPYRPPPGSPGPELLRIDEQQDPAPEDR